MKSASRQVRNNRPQGDGNGGVAHLHYSIHPPHTQNATEPGVMTETLRSDASLIHINKSATMSNDFDCSDHHKIEFTKTESCTPSTCACLCIAVLCISIGATSGLYFSMGLYEGTMLKERVFKGQFTITRGESYNPKFEDPNSDEFREVARLYRNKLDSLYSSSHYGKLFKSSEVIALEKSGKSGSDDVTVHFNLHLTPQHKPKIDVADLYLVLGDEILNSKKRMFQNITVDTDSISLQERRPYAPKRGLFHSSAVSFPANKYFSSPQDPWEPRVKFPGLLEGLKTDPTPPPRRCMKLALPYCKILPYNHTSYPNIMGHWNATSLEDEFITFRQIADSECYQHARQFLCAALQPECENDEMLWPCKEFCQEFLSACEPFIPILVAKRLTCKNYPTWSDSDKSDQKQKDNVQRQSDDREVKKSLQLKRKRKSTCRRKEDYLS